MSCPNLPHQWIRLGRQRKVAASSAMLGDHIGKERLVGTLGVECTTLDAASDPTAQAEQARSSAEVEWERGGAASAEAPFSGKLWTDLDEKN